METEIDELRDEIEQLHEMLARLVALIRDVQPWSAALPEHLSRRLIEALPLSASQEWSDDVVVGASPHSSDAVSQ